MTQSFVLALVLLSAVPMGRGEALAILAGRGAAPDVRAQAGLDHRYGAYGDLLRAHVRGARVDYRSLKANRAALEAVVHRFGTVTEQDVVGWSRPQQIAFWIDAYTSGRARIRFLSYDWSLNDVTDGR